MKLFLHAPIGSLNSSSKEKGLKRTFICPTFLILAQPLENKVL